MNFKKEFCQEIKRRIRAHVHIRVRDCLAYRCVLGERDLLMGGVVLKKNRKVDHIVRRDEIATVITRMSLDEYQKVPVEERRPDDVAYDEIVLYDFSGEMKVCPSIDDRDVRIKINLLGVDDVVYVIGRVIALNSSEGFFVKIKNVLSESDLKFYQSVNSKYLNQIKENVKKLISQPVVFEPSHALFCYRNTGEILKYFLTEKSQISIYDYMDLASAFYEKHFPFTNERGKEAVRRLFLRSLRQMNGINPEKFLEELYPLMKLEANK